MTVAEESAERDQLLRAAERKLNRRLLPCLGLLSIM